MKKKKISKKDGVRDTLLPIARPKPQGTAAASTSPT